MSWEIREGNCLELLADMPEGSVQTCITSPPYWGLRDYGTAIWSGGNPDCDHLEQVGGTRSSTLGAASGGNDMSDAARKRSTTRSFVPYKRSCAKCGARRVDDQLGLEPTPEEYVGRMVEVFRAVWRVLRDDGTLWLNLGDSYMGGGGGNYGSGISTASDHGQHLTNVRNRQDFIKNTGLKPKDLVGIPWRVALALQADGWYLRSDIIWHKPNPMPESVTDRPTKAHEYLFLLTKQPHYYYDADAIRERAAAQNIGEMDGGAQRNGDGSKANQGRNFRNQGDGEMGGFVGSRNKRSVWTVTTKPFSGAHFAVFPPDLIEPCVLAGSSPTTCGDCGAPFRRVVTKRKTWESGSGRAGNRPHGKYGEEHQGDIRMGPTIETETTGWEPTCDHEDDTGESVVLDPFSGSGTTGLVALRHDRSYIGLELNPEYAELSRNRIRDDAPLLNTTMEVM